MPLWAWLKLPFRWTAWPSPRAALLSAPVALALQPPPSSGVALFWAQMLPPKRACEYQQSSRLASLESHICVMVWGFRKDTDCPSHKRSRPSLWDCNPLKILFGESKNCKLDEVSHLKRHPCVVPWEPAAASLRSARSGAGQGFASMRVFNNAANPQMSLGV